MTIHSAKRRTLATSSLFAAFALGGIGWGLLHAWGISLKTGLSFHILAAIPGLVLSGVVLYRYRQHWPVNPSDGAVSLPNEPKFPWRYQTLAFSMLLIGIGFSLALFIRNGSAFLVALGAIGTVLVPWEKIAICRDHFFFASALVGAGAVSGLVPGGSVHPIYYPVAAWLLLAVASMVIISVILSHGNRLERMPVSGYEDLICS